MSSVPAASSTALLSIVIFPTLIACAQTYASYNKIAKSGGFDWSSNPGSEVVLLQKAITLLFAASIGCCSAFAIEITRRLLRSHNWKVRIVVTVLTGKAIGSVNKFLSSNLLTICRNVQKAVEHNIYPLVGWQTPGHKENFLPFPFNLTTKRA